MRLRLILGALLGEIWGMAGFGLLMIPSLRDPVGAALGGAAPFVLALFPTAWLLPLFNDYAGREPSRLLIPGAASVLVGIGAGMLLAWTAYRGAERRRQVARARRAAAGNRLQKLGRSWGWYDTIEGAEASGGAGAGFQHKASAD
jgi:membrane associated rhomboid family serine protease